MTSEADESSSILDPETIRVLRNLGTGSGEPVLVSVARQFASSELASDLFAAAQAGDAEAVRRVAHMLKGRSAMVGARRLAELAGNIEAGPEELVGNEERQEEVRRECERVVEALRQAAEELGSDDVATERPFTQREH